MTSLLAPLTTGTLFGTALTLSSMYLPTSITTQFSLTSTHMLTTFLTASAISALIIYFSNRSGFATLPPRSNTSYGWVGAYDGNLVGGVLQGVGMAVTGTCPGTGIVQVALGVEGARWVVLGGVLGGLGFVGLGGGLRRDGSGSVLGKGQVKGHTVMQRLKVSGEVAVLGYEVLLVGAILLADRLGPLGVRDRSLLNPVLGGSLIGIAQAMSVLLSRKTLGVSSAYSDVAAHVRSLLKGEGFGSAGFGNIVFAVGVGLGAKLVSSRVHVLVGPGMGLSVPVASAGGFVTIFGARMAGGCTSGHGISGMSTLSLSSFVTVVGMFGAGIIVRTLLKGI